MKEDTYQFVLASASERRRMLLEKAGYHFEIIVSNIDESVFDRENTSPAQYAIDLALAKARHVASLRPDKLVLGADTIVDSGGEIIGKAADSRHAEQITRKLFSAPHEVITGIAFVKQNEEIEITESVTTTIYPRPLSEQEIRNHIQSGKWEGKAGAYGIQEGGDAFIERIEGSFTNVVGLPMERVGELLKELL